MVPEPRPEVIDFLAGTAEAEGGIVVVANETSAGRTASASLRDTGQACFDDGWPTRNSGTSKLMAWQSDRFIREFGVFEDRFLLPGPMQAELLAPAGLGREIAVMIAIGIGITVSVHRRRRETPR